MLRIPSWCDAPHVKVNGASIGAIRAQNGFLVLSRKFNPGDVVTLNLPMKVAVTEWPDNGVGVERGPLVYALPVDAKWSSFAEAGYSSEEFPTWEARPTGKWNYGVALEPGKASHVEVRKKKSAAGLENSPWPWSDAPVSLVVPAREVEGWELRSNPQNPKQKFTSPLPKSGTYKTSNKLERIALVPYGATQLRVSIFPKLKG